MRARSRSIVASGVALVSAVTIVATTPAVLSSSGLTVAGIAQPLAVRSGNVELAALADITVKGIVDAYWSGWGGYIGPTNGQPDKYYPNINPTGSSPVYVSGASGVAYYVIDEALDQFGSVNLDNYFFEAGAYYGTGKATSGSAVGALIYVGSSELFGDKSPIAQLAKAVFYYGITPLTQSTILQLATLVPTVKIGPVKVGGGILASLYFTGQTPDGKYSFGSAGLSAVLGYITTSISDALPKVTAATIAGAATKQVTAPAVVDAVSATSSATTTPASAPTTPTKPFATGESKAAVTATEPMTAVTAGTGSAKAAAVQPQSEAASSSSPAVESGRDKGGDSGSASTATKSGSALPASRSAVGHANRPASTLGAGDSATKSGAATATKSGAGVKADNKSGEKASGAAEAGGKSGGETGGSHNKD